MILTVDTRNCSLFCWPCWYYWQCSYTQVKKRARNILELTQLDTAVAVFLWKLGIDSKINLHIITCHCFTCHWTFFMIVNKLFTKRKLLVSAWVLYHQDSRQFKFIWFTSTIFCCWIMQIRNYSTNWIPLCSDHDKISRSQRLCIRFYCKKVRTEAREQEER